MLKNPEHVPEFIPRVLDIKEMKGGKYNGRKK